MQKELEAAGHTTSTTAKQGVTKAGWALCSLPLTQSRIPDREWHCPGSAGLLTPIKQSRHSPPMNKPKAHLPGELILSN